MLLSPREREIVELAAQGLSNDEIAWRLSVKTKTVANTLQSAYGKLGVNSRQAAAQALGIPYPGRQLPISAAAIAPPQPPVSDASFGGGPGGMAGWFASLSPPVRGWPRLGLILLVSIVVSSSIAGIVVLAAGAARIAEVFAPERGF